MIDMLLTVTGIIAVGLVAVELLRRRSAALRHAVLTIALVCAAIAPAVRPVVPSWHVPPRLLSAGRTPLALYIPIEATDATRSGLDRPRPLDTRATALRWLARAWLAGIALGVAWLATGFGRLAWIASRARRVVEGDRFERLQLMSRDFRLRRRVTLLQSDHPSLLGTWGVLTPTIILPRTSGDWTLERERIVLSHELSHIVRRDWIVQVAAEIVRIAYWFNPFVWIACRRLRRESEQACDDAVLGTGVAAPEYATHLLEIARACRASREPFIPAPAMARPSSLERRVTAMLNNRLNRAPLTRSALVFVVIALIAVTLSIAGVHASADATAQFSGTLVDAVGRIMPDAPLILTGSDGLRSEARSDQIGHFSFTGLAGGDYVLGVNVPGFATTQGRVTLGDGQNLVQDVALQLGLLQETLSVTNGPAGATQRSAPIDYEPKPSTCPQTIVGGCIEQPVMLVHVKPLFPAELSGLGQDVVVQLEARIGTDGFVNDVRALAPANEAAALAAASAVRQWRFSQTRLDGVPVEVRMDVRINFRAE